MSLMSMLTSNETKTNLDEERDDIIQSLNTIEASETAKTDNKVDKEQTSVLNALIQYDANNIDPNSETDAETDADYQKNKKGEVTFAVGTSWNTKLANVSDDDIEAFVLKFDLNPDQEMTLRDSFDEACVPGCGCGM